MRRNSAGRQLMPAGAQGFRRLVAGNRRFAARERLRSGSGRSTLTEMVAGQQPFATILGCSDSRVPPELLFDQGFGDLFIIRVAGNVVSAEVLGSVQYAGAHLRTPLFVVLGHEGCGAVGAALAAKFYGATTTRKRISALLRSIVPGLGGVDPALPSDEQLRVAVEANVRWSMRQLEETPEARRALAERRAMLVGAIYELGTGRVRFSGRGSGRLRNQGARRIRRIGGIPPKKVIRSRRPDAERRSPSRPAPSSRSGGPKSDTQVKTEGQPRFRGYSIPLATLSFAEMWERFGYCG